LDMFWVRGCDLRQDKKKVLLLAGAQVSIL
jgi:hypothetical protein